MGLSPSGALPTNHMDHESLDAPALAEEMFSVNLTPEQIARFWSKVTEKGLDECWLWNAAVTGSGRPHIHLKKLRKNFVASRIAYFLMFGPFPKRLFACHKCDNPLCVNPYHLFLGTAKDNQQDMSRKGRSWVANNPEKMPRGEGHKSSKLKAADVLVIRSYFPLKSGDSKLLCALYGIKKETIYAIQKRRIWKHLP